MQQFIPWREKLSGSAHYPWLIFLCVTTGTLLQNLDKSISSIALPSLATFFGAEPQTLQWVVSANLLAISCTLPSFGRLSDLVGRKKVFVWGLFIYTAGSLLVGVAGSMGWLIAFRVVQALGTSLFVSNVMAIIINTFPPEQKGKAFGVLSMVVAAGNILGPALGGLIIERMGWRWGYLLLVPLALASALAAVVLLPQRQRAVEKEPFDYPGSLSLAAALGALILYLSNGQRWGWGSPPAWVVLGIFLGALVFFFWREKHFPHPLLNLAVFRVPGFVAGNLVCYLTYILLFAFSVLTPLFLAQVEGYSPSRLGFVMLLWPLAMLPASSLGEWLQERFGFTTTTALGMLAFVIACGLFSTWGQGLKPWTLVLPMLLVGLAMGFLTVANQQFLMSALPGRQAGMANGIVASVRNIGSVSGVSLGVLLFTAGLGEAGGTAREMPSYLLAYGRAFGEVFRWGFYAGLAGTAFCAWSLNGKRLRGAGKQAGLPN